ncbi:MAG: hypothetical protein GXP35_15905 [Actinobacteria bacterium]|nr:hypothetical protein [Actinomycetota bacterium]
MAATGRGAIRSIEQPNGFASANGLDVVVQHGSASELHGRPLISDRAVLELIEVDGPAIVLGSAQRSVLVHNRVEAEVVRRRGGGGAVWVGPTDGVWFDITIPRDDDRWVQDVGVAFGWLGDALELWLRPWLIDVQVVATVHRGGLRAGPYSDLICFAGAGPGELFVDDRKLVGISQRRTREASRFMCWMPTVWSAALLVEALVDRSRTIEAMEAVGEAGVGLIDLGIDAAAVKRELIA